TALESISLVQFGLSDTTVFLNPYLTATLLVYIPFNLLKMFFVSFAFISVKRTLIHQIEKFI
ncbi:MAG: hypothetical protein ACRCZC_07790, partial [Culicoidibacterales bacterium]